MPKLRDIRNNKIHAHRKESGNLIMQCSEQYAQYMHKNHEYLLTALDFNKKTLIQ